jgi:hypothetical protein
LDEVDKENHMAIRGLSYLKTTWSFQERPVASAKLNTWDDRIEGAIELLSHLLSLQRGGHDGIIRGAATGDLHVTAQTAPDLTVKVAAGYAMISRLPFKVAAATVLGPVAAPVTSSRVDIVQAQLPEAVSPAIPTADVDCIVLARLYLKPGMTSIKDSNDGVNGYIQDVRTFQ